MKLFYTVASQQDATQTKPSLSLGGYKSANQVPSSSFGNLFGDISMYTVKNNNSNAYIGLILLNDEPNAADPAAIYCVNMWFEFPEDKVSTFKIAAVDLNTDEDGYKYMEQISSYTSKPLYAEFVEADGEINRVNLGDMAIGDMIGIWIERTLDLEAISSQQNAIYEVDPADPYRFLEVTPSKSDEILIGINWEKL
jgi:hypothetical protein